MWARTFEVALGCWLLISPFIFGHDPEDSRPWITDLVAGSAIILLALISFGHRFRRAHLLELAVALWLIAAGYFSGTPPTAAAQNQIAIGLLLAMFAIIPTDANDAPESWRNL